MKETLPPEELLLALCDMTAVGIVKMAQRLSDRELAIFSLSREEINQCAWTLNKIVRMGKAAQKMSDLPPINSVVKVIKTVAEQDPILGQTGTVIQYSAHGMVCVHFSDMPTGQGIFFNAHHLQIIES
jgi:hypothetical protein